MASIQHTLNTAECRYAGCCRYLAGRLAAWSRSWPVSGGEHGFVFRRPDSAPARQHKPGNALCPAPSQKDAIRGYLPGKSSESTSDKANSALNPSSRPHCAGSGCRRSQAMHASGTRASSAKRYRCGAQVATDQSLHCLSSQKLLAICGTFGHSAVEQYRRGVQAAIYQPLRRSASQKLLAICGTFGHSAAEQISVSLSRR